MRIARQPVGYLINFGHKGTLEWKRLILSELISSDAQRHASEYGPYFGPRLARAQVEDQVGQHYFQLFHGSWSETLKELSGCAVL